MHEFSFYSAGIYELVEQMKLHDEILSYLQCFSSSFGACIMPVSQAL